MDHDAAAKRRTAIVLSGGGARGAYEAGVLSYLFEEIYPRLPTGFEFDIVSGTSVGAIHAGYIAASAQLDAGGRYFDWRVYYDKPSDDFYFTHSLCGCKVSEAAAAVRDFLADNIQNFRPVRIQIRHG